MPPNDDAPTLRETIESAMNAGAEPGPDTAAIPESPDQDAAEPALSTSETDTRTAAERARDDKGRFANKTGEAPTDKKAAPTPPKGAEKAASPAVKAQPAGAVAPPTTTAPAGEPPSPFKAPQSWKPAVRELAAKLPPEFRPILEESIRVDNEAKRALNDSARARQLAEQVQSTLAPYEGIARASGMDSMKWMGSVAQTAATLHLGSPQQRAQVVASLIGAYGVDVEAVNAFMQGQPPPQGHQAQAQQPVDVNRAVEEAFSRRMQSAVEARAQSAWQEFEASEPEFLSDAIKDSMRLIIEHEAQRGRNVTYQQAYDRACRMDEEVSSVLASRKSAEAVRAQAPTVQRAKVAASSIKAVPAATGTRPGAGPNSLRETIEAAVAGQRT